MVGEGSIEEIVSRVEELLNENSDSSTFVELANLSNSTYNQLKKRFEDNYNVIGIINILRIEPDNKNRPLLNYILHIGRRQNA